MTDSTQLTSRETLDLVIQRTIAIYRWAVAATFGFIGVGVLIAIVSDQDVDSKMGLPATLIKEVFQLESSGFIGIGISIMVLTPIVMIATGAASFFASGDRKYGWITVSVAAILSLSIIISFVIG